MILRTSGDKEFILRDATAGPRKAFDLSRFHGVDEDYKIFPLCQFPIQIHIVFVAQQLIKLPLVSSMGTLHLSIEPRCPWLNVDMIVLKIGQMPVKLRLELMAVIRPDRVNPERKLGQDIIDELNGILLVCYR